MRYQQAAKLLEEAAKNREDLWGSFQFPELKGEPEDFNDSQFKDRVNAVLEARKEAVENPNGWGKCFYAMQCAFAAFSPFAKNFLTAAQAAQSVSLFQFNLLHRFFRCLY